MKLLNTIIILSFFFVSTFAQINIQGKVIDSETKKPVSYVNIGVKKMAIGTVSDNNGAYQLSLKKKDDLVTFSSIGYEEVNIVADDLLRNNEIQLIPKKYQLQNVEIFSQKFEGEDQLFGVKNKNRGLSIGFGSRQLGTEIGALISIKKSTFIKNANFVLNHVSEDGDSLLFRVNIYDYQDGILGEKILKENVYIKSLQKRGVITVDLIPYNLILEKDVLLTLEWIKDDNGKGNSGITFDTKKSKKSRGIYLKKMSVGGFDIMKKVNHKLKPCFYFIGKTISEK